MSDIKIQLSEELADVQWRDLIPHAQRDVLIVVSPSLNIVDVGVAIAGDKVTLVQDWIAQNLVYKPTPERLSEWNTTPEKLFSTVIVQPFVLIQSVSSPD